MHKCRYLRAFIAGQDTKVTPSVSVDAPQGAVMKYPPPPRGIVADTSPIQKEPGFPPLKRVKRGRVENLDSMGWDAHLPARVVSVDRDTTYLK